MKESEERKVNRAAFLNEAEQKFKEDHKEEIEAYEKYLADKAKKETQEYGADDAQEEEVPVAAVSPVQYVFDSIEPSAKFDEENPTIVIPDALIADIDNDWILDEEETSAIISAYWAARGETA